MNDKRIFHNFLNILKNESPDALNMIESIQDVFENDIEAITDADIKALKRHPIQFVKRIPMDDGEWTTKIHVWAEQSVPQILKLDPIYLGFKNSSGDSVLMCMVIGATGAHTGKVNHKLIKDILDVDYAYEETDTDDEGNDVIVTKNALDEVDLDGQTVIDYLIDVAFGKGEYDEDDVDPILQDILGDFSYDPISEEPEKMIDEVPDETETEEVSSEPTPQMDSGSSDS
jgi:hypothetical protein